MPAIIKKELRAYFTSPIGFVFLGVFYAMAGFYFSPLPCSLTLPT